MNSPSLPVTSPFASEVSGRKKRSTLAPCSRSPAGLTTCPSTAACERHVVDKSNRTTNCTAFNVCNFLTAWCRLMSERRGEELSCRSGEVSKGSDWGLKRYDFLTIWLKLILYLRHLWNSFIHILILRTSTSAPSRSLLRSVLRFILFPASRIFRRSTYFLT